jgi:hypothetical protein
VAKAEYMATTHKKPKNGHPRGIFRSIFICAKQELSPFGTAFVFKADNIEGQKLGTVFGIIKIEDRSENSSYITNLLTSVIKKEYFGKPHRGAEESFEAALKKANLALAELARHGALNWSGKLNFAGGALERSNLHFACLGEVSVFLARGGQVAEISKDFQEELDAETHPLKTFSNISSGKLEKGDKLIFATRDLTEIFSREELRQNTAHFSREEFPGFLEMSLEANADLAGAVVIDLADESEIRPADPLTPTIEKQKIPQFIDVIAANTRRVEKKPESYFSGAESQRNILPTSAAVSTPEETGQPSIWQKFSEISKDIFTSASEKSKRLLLRFSSFLRRVKTGEKLKSLDIRKSALTVSRFGTKTKTALSRTERYLHSLDPKIKKIILGIAGIIFLTTIIALIVASKNKQAAIPVAQPQTAPAETKPALALNDIQAKNIDSVETVANLEQENSKFALLDGTLYSISGKDKIVTKINLDSNSTEEMKSGLPGGNFGLIAAMPHLNSLFLLTEGKEVVSLTPSNKNFQTNNISLPANLAARDIRSYLTYLYVLDIGNSQILRYPRAEGGFGEGQSWLRDKIDLKNAKGISINDDLYLAESDKITAFLQGKKDSNIDFDSPQTPLSIDAIYSGPEMEFVWILDNKNHRVIRFTKDGKISAQYFNEAISDIKDFTVDEKNKTVYLLQRNSILKFSFD